MHVERLWLTDFRNYAGAELAPAPAGLTVVEGLNGEGKTNLLEAIGYLANLRSFRGSPTEALVRTGAERAVVRGQAWREGRGVLIEAELPASGRARVQVNRQPLRRNRDLAEALVVTVFTPDDLELVKGGPQQRRDYLDELLAVLHPRHAAAQAEVEGVLKQRNALLKQAGGVAKPEVAFTLDVWDAKLATAGEALVAARVGLLDALERACSAAYEALGVAAAHRGRDVLSFRYLRSWEGPLVEALAAARTDDLRRGVSTVGPHRDDVALSVGGLPARTHASQGEQRSLALALRLGGHGIVRDRIGSAPVLLLDDVFSELDPTRSEALLACLPEGQAILTTAGDLPAGARAAARARVEDGKLAVVEAGV